MQNIVKRLYARAVAVLPPSAFLPPAEPEKLRRFFFGLLAVWAVGWFLLPLAVLDNAFIDVSENIIWGSHFQLGYDKNPYLGAWIGYLGYLLAGKELWSSFLLSQLFVVAGVYAVWRLSLRMTTPAGAFLATVLLLGLNFYGIKSVELCDDVMELGFWPLLIWSFYCALRGGNRTGAWLLTGFLAGCCFMIKYYGAVLFVSMFALMLATPEGRAAFRRPGPYLGGVLFALMSLPNLFWLRGQDMVAFRYAFDRASLDDGIPAFAFTYERLLNYPLRTVERAFSVIVVPLVPFFLLFFRRDAAMSPERFDRCFTAILGWGPFALTLLFSLVSGGSVNYSWVVPCFPLLGLFLVVWWKPLLNRFSLRYFTGFVMLFGVILMTVFVVRSLWVQPYRKPRCDYENFPGRTLSARLTAEWRTRYGTPLPFVIGDRRESCNVAIYSPDRPEAYFSANPQYSQWIDENEIREKGALILIDASIPRRPKWPAKLLEAGFTLTPETVVEEERAVPGWFRAFAGTPKSDAYIYRFIPPRQ